MESEENGNYSTISFDNESTQHIVQDVIFTLICIVAMTANVLLICTTFKFKRMRTVPHIILANWAIADLTCLLTTPSTYRLIVMADRISLSSLFMCTLYEVGSAAQVTVIIYAFLLSLDWYIAAYFENASKKFRKYINFYIVIIWISMFSVLCISIVFCINRYFAHWIYVIMASFGYICLFLFIIVLQICRIVRKCRRRELSYPTLMLTIATALVLSWFMSFAHMCVMGIQGVFFRIIGIISMTLLFCTGILVFIILYKKSNDFHACLNRLLKRDRNNYEEADFNFHSSGRKPIVKNIAHCSFNNKEQNVFVC
ncbi:hypothetical protein RN001_012505 [Aquatica leii]|uniref:G-protein coupled receptors family 1 profile domain-containing protein n=1 Tax=Aquatica leii TaxID=1421715 RepID=A0AAN7P5I6_9COLE|nr:hypothetical protein RN001_012505 [Aquatica leii]